MRVQGQPLGLQATLCECGHCERLRSCLLFKFLLRFIILMFLCQVCPAHCLERAFQKLVQQWVKESGQEMPYWMGSWDLIGCLIQGEGWRGGPPHVLLRGWVTRRILLEVVTFWYDLEACYKPRVQGKCDAQCCLLLASPRQCSYPHLSFPI